MTMPITNLSNDSSDFDLEYHDVVKDPNDPEMQQIAEKIPERYKGKSTEDLINMHVNLEKVLHRQGNELGQLRRTVDSQAKALEATVTRQNHNPLPDIPTKSDPITAERLLNDPASAISQTVNPALQDTNKRIDGIEKSLAQQAFEQKHPTWMDDIQSKEFQDWVAGSRTRGKLIAALDKYDFDAGHDLWELWGEHQTATQAAKTAQKDKIRAATTVKGSAGEPVGKPVYSRAKLAELQMRAMGGDPAAQARWNDPEFQKEYQLAYAEDRVK